MMPDNRRIDRSFFTYSATTADLPTPEMRESINRLAGIEFTDGEFGEMAIAVAACAGKYRSRRNAPPKEDAAKRFEEIAKAAERLARLLWPGFDPDFQGNTRKGIVADYAAQQIHLWEFRRSTSEYEQTIAAMPANVKKRNTHDGGAAAVTGFSILLSLLGALKAVAIKNAERTRASEVLPQGGE